MWPCLWNRVNDGHLWWPFFGLLEGTPIVGERCQWCQAIARVRPVND